MDKHEALQQYFGHATFRDGQEEVVDAILQGRDVLGIMPTGAGKSVCYQLSAMLLSGLTIVISPLISLMKDQVDSLLEIGISAAYLNSSMDAGEYQVTMLQARQGIYRILYVAPERLQTEGFLSFAEQAEISMVTVDEAHCVSQWGQDFRQSYLGIAEFLNKLQKRPIVSAFTATATEQVCKDICRLLQLQDPFQITTGFDRKNLYFAVRTPRNKERELLELLQERRGKSGIVYCLARKTVEELCDRLCEQGFPATRYHAGLSQAERAANQEAFLFDTKPIMIATNAFGMGIDKSNVSFVVHYNMPKDLESYYQEAGRAGRDGEEAECVLFFSKQDIMINKRLLEYKSTESIESDPQVRRNDYQKLNRMIDYCETQQCLRQFILSYFGDNSPCTCDKCSNCVVVEDEEEENYIQTKKEKKKAFQLANLTPKGQELFEQLRKCRTELAAEKGVPPYIICSDKTLTDMCAKCPADNEDMETVYGMGVQKIQSYGEHFTKIIIDFLEEQSAAGGADAETLQLTTELTPEQIEETTGITVAASPAREKKLPFYIAPGKLDEVELTDTCMISELTNRINELCDEEDQKNRKKLTAAFVNTLLIQKGYIEEATEGEEKVKHITEKGKEAGIQEEERYGKYGRKYYALVHTRESQEMILGELREYLADLTDE